MKRRIARMVLMVAATTAVGRAASFGAADTTTKAEIITPVIKAEVMQNVALNDIVSSEEIESEEIVDESADATYEYNDINIYNVNYTGWKTWMDYRSITKVSSKQYQLQQVCYTGNYGMRMYDGRYCIAVGTGTGCKVGDYVDLILENGVRILCIVSDMKASIHTTSDNIFTNVGKHLCASEFVVDESQLDEKTKTTGDASNISEFWNSKVITIRKYQRNYFTEED